MSYIVTEGGSVDAQGRTDEQILGDAEVFVRKAQARLKRGSKRVSDEVYKLIQTRLNELRHAIKENEPKRMRALMARCDELLEEHLAPQKSSWREYAESIGIAVLFALALRGFVIEAFRIPTESMVPTLLAGDFLFVNKFSYGVRVPFTKKFITKFELPERGEVAVFTFPKDEARAHIAGQHHSKRSCIDRASLEEEKEFIKRVVGLPGDTIEIRDNRLIVNGERLKRTFVKKKTTGSYLHPHTEIERERIGDREYTIQYHGSNRNFGPIRVAPGHIFMMGDNRDNSSDSRCWGQVPLDNLIGRAMIIWWSIDGRSVRWDRIGDLIE